MLACRICLGFLALSLLATSIRGESPGELSPDAPDRAELSRWATYQVDSRVVVIPPANTRKLRVWLPLAQPSRAQQIEGRQLATFPRPVEPSIHQESLFGNTFAYFEFDSPVGPQLITQQFTARIAQMDWQVDYSAVAQRESWPASFQPYQRIDPRTKQGAELRAVIGEIGSSQQSAAQRLVGAIDWVDQNLTYDHAVASLSADPMHALVHRRGHCSDYHGLCSTLAQKLGYPSRVVYGLQMFDKSSPSHCKMEVFLPPYGWVTYDLSETQKLAVKIAADSSLSTAEQKSRIGWVKQRTMKGFRENTWLQVTRGTNYELSPRASQPVPLVRTIYAEADGKPLADPDPANPNDHSWSSLSLHRVDGDQAAKRFQSLPAQTASGDSSQ